MAAAAPSSRTCGVEVSRRYKQPRRCVDEGVVSERGASLLRGVGTEMVGQNWIEDVIEDVSHQEGRPQASFPS